MTELQNRNKLSEGEAGELYSIEPHESPSVAIVKAVAKSLGKAMDELQPLFYAIDPDALDTLLANPHEETIIEFSYEEYVIKTDGESICMSPIE